MYLQGQSPGIYIYNSKDKVLDYICFLLRKNKNVPVQDTAYSADQLLFRPGPGYSLYFKEQHPSIHLQQLTYLQHLTTYIVYVYIYISTYIHPTLHYIALHYVPMQYNDSTFTLLYTKLHYITLHCIVHTSQSPSNCTSGTMVRHVQALCLGSIQDFLQSLLECRLGSLQDAI